MKTSFLTPAVIMAAFLLVGSLERPESPLVDDFGQTTTVMLAMESATPQPPENPEFSLSKYVEKRACRPLADMLRDLEPLHWPENVLSVGVEFVLTILDCRRLQI